MFFAFWEWLIDGWLIDTQSVPRSSERVNSWWNGFLIDENFVSMLFVDQFSNSQEFLSGQLSFE